MPDVGRELVALDDEAFNRLMSRLEGLTDDEYLWEPASDCWTLRPNEDGKLTWEGGVLFDEVPPITTIAWRMCHIADCLAAERCARWLGLEPAPSVFAGGLPATADAAIRMLGRAHEIWRGYLEAVDDDDLWANLGPAAEAFADQTRVGFALHILDELIHHAAEVALLRDLYRAEHLHDPFVAACLRGDRAAIDEMRVADAGVLDRAIAEHPALMLRAAATGRWEALPLLAELGFSIDGVGGRSPIHHAAGAGELDAIRFLVGLGADVNSKDPVYDATPLVWAEYFGRTEAAVYLQSLAASSASS